MTRSPLWREFESGDSFLLKALRFCILFGGICFLIFTGVLELTWPQQAVLGLLTVLLAIWMDRSSSSYLITLTLMLISMYATFRYGFWRVSQVIKFFLDPGNTQWTALDAFFIWLLVGAEAYAFVILFLGYLQTLWPLRRTPVPLPEDPDNWPAVDLLIPTYNEPLSVVRFTALAAMNIDWPADKLNVYILDDGKREEFRQFAQDAGVGYMTRDDNKFAKAGNINRALERLDAPFVAIFDSDHVPTRSFMQVTMGWFLRDRKLGMLQTPHHFYSPDPFERNLDQFRVIPNEGELFYGVVQDGNDFWNATFFCGSCAVLRRTALDEIGGIAVETVTEDAHTSLRMQMNGWNTAYINIPQAAGLATERLSGHVKQRIRWARGMVQILRIENPLFVGGLTIWQRLCYFNAMTHFLYALPRLIFLTAPLIYLIFGHTNVPGYWAAILAYAFPHLMLSSLTNSRIQGQHRHSFWNEIYETVLAPYIFLPTMLALINPKLGSFNVTAKGGVVNKSFFDSRIALPFLVLLGFNVFGVLMAIPRYFHIPYLERVWDGTHPGTIIMNLIWTFFNITILGVATAVAWESQQRRSTVRVAMSVPADVVLADGTIIQGVTADLSSGGVMVTTDRSFTALPGESVKLIFPVLDGDASLPGTIVSADGRSIRAQFDPLNLQEEEALTMVLYSRADTWLGWGEAREADRPLFSLLRIFQLSYHGLSQTIRGLMRNKKSTPKGKFATNVAPLLLFALLAGFSGRHASAQVQSSRYMGVPNSTSATAEVPRPATFGPGAPAPKPVAPGAFDNTFQLADVGVPDTIVLRGVDAYHSVFFSLPQTQVVKTAKMHLRYHFSPGLIPDISHLNVSLNGTLFATLPVKTRPDYVNPNSDLTPSQKVAEQQVLNVTRNENNALLEADLVLPADMLVHSNELTFEFIGHYTFQCEDPSHTTLWSHVDASSTIELAGALLPLSNDLKLLPLPFYDAAVNLHPSIPIVFLSQPSPKALRAAGIVASYFGILTNDHPVRFPVSVGTIPAGNAIVIGESASELPPSLSVNSSSGPTIAMRTNPNDLYAKVLILTGDNADDLVSAAEGLVLQHDMLESDQQRVSFNPKSLADRKPDDAPRWLSTEKNTTLGDITNGGELQGDGSVPVGVYLRVPPDLFYGAQQNLGFHMGYRYNGIPLANESSLQVYMNGAYVSSTPMPHTDKATAVEETIVPIPVIGDMRPFSNSMMMRFVFQIAKKGKCQDTAPLNLQGVIMKDSYLDIKDIPHWAILPNLEIFANAGYPFTRKADLADTAVVLPDTPSVDEVEMFLTFMGHFGAQTGYPVLNVTVTNNDGMKSDHIKDYLVMGTVEDQPALTRLDPLLPVRVDGGGLHIQDTQGFFSPLQHAWWKVRSSDHIQSGQLETAGGLPDALIEGIEWPAGSGKSVVLIALRDHTVVPNFLTVFLKTSQSSDVSQSVSVLHGTKFSSYRIGNDVYRVGSLSLWIRLNLWFSQYSWLDILMVLVICFLMAALIRATLRRRARTRLQGSE
ncbi:UDP-forming cellulose synthase catalytic subunit [Granulicella tundricola]|uniref:Cellulose synthase catalytic subunit [UDP-forming] n=1 Tax=Granulicella tundricola (strain ATCC BAA-1859 / DSM 23138 / MP5ACTX9) TaxID=1198114 RepID=E8X1E3_GRATM|nr:UDP-forming cellulose synthase catalytic subunit [Granulicella tundricola]ADW69097.1 cellulose synthase catalytic subunit (UDP-forming) [Granulicella tundricola MP5ACTX9]